LRRSLVRLLCSAFNPLSSPDHAGKFNILPELRYIKHGFESMIVFYKPPRMALTISRNGRKINFQAGSTNYLWVSFIIENTEIFQISFM
jgi:hypothetical protein